MHRVTPDMQIKRGTSIPGFPRWVFSSFPVEPPIPEPNLALSNYCLSLSGTLILEKGPYLAEHGTFEPSPEPIPKQSAFQKNCKWQSLS